MSGRGPGERGTVLSGSCLGGAQPEPRRGPREAAARPTVPLALHSAAFGMEVWELQENPRLAVLLPQLSLIPIPVRRYFSDRPSFFLVVHFCHFKKALHFMCTSCFVAQNIKKMWLRTTT